MSLNRNLASQAELGSQASLLSGRNGVMVGGILMPSVRSSSSFAVTGHKHKNNLLYPLARSAMGQIEGIRNKRILGTQAVQSRYK